MPPDTQSAAVDIESQTGTLPSCVIDPARPAHSRCPLLFECVRLAWGNSRSSQLFVIALSGLVAILEWGRNDPLLIAVWFAYQGLAALYRLNWTRQFKEQNPQPDAAVQWRDRFVISCALSGLGWGASALLFLNPGDLPSGYAVVLFLTGVTAAGVPYQAAIPRAAILFSTLITGAVAARLFSGSLIFVQMGVMAMLYLVTLITIILLVHRSIVNSLALRFENASLVAVLSDANRKIETANAELRAEISQRSAAESRLAHSLSLLQATFEATVDGILMVNNGGKVASYNQRFLRMWSIPESMLAGDRDRVALRHALGQLISPAEALRRMRERILQPNAECHDVIEFRDGRVFECFSKPQHVAGLCVGCVWSFRDITERYRVEQDLFFIANHDPLTGLLNRTMFYRRLNSRIIRCENHGGRFAVLFIDLDRFKNINDTLGHDAGDYLLKDVSRRLTETLRDTDVVARLGGDEFVVLLQDYADAADVDGIARKLLDAFAQPFVIDHREIRLSASIGISVFPDDSDDSSGLLKDADIAMYRAKDQGGSVYEFYAARPNLHSVDRLSLESKLQRAIEREEFTLHYQPRVDLRNGRIVCVEALIRWQHPDLGLVLPDTFIPLAEESGLIVPLGDWVLREACSQMHRFEERGLPPLRVAVNLSGRQFGQPDLMSRVSAALEAAHIDPGRLEVEITESMVMTDAERSIEILREMTARRIIVSIDDFGTGYSSLSYLKRFPIHNLKIDRAFITDLPHDIDDAAITQAVIAMAHRLGLRVIAEGVEQSEQLLFLAANDCDEVQGYLVAKPMPAHELEALIQRGIDIPVDAEPRDTARQQSLGLGPS
ncbi:MAG TPA: EAL domain-containing protein [Burkholderiales bacterium]|jgi:diguanylate cyclase (GGDEF)-like protein|nr:EAL domain-containing protein [Burkholderiales bacterium]